MPPPVPPPERKKRTIQEIRDSKTTGEKMVYMSVPEYTAARWAEMAGVDVAVVDGDLPLVSPQVRGLRLSVSPQTGGCESDRDSALGEGCPRDEQKSGADCQDGNEAVNAGECKPHKILLTNSLGD